MDFIQAMKLVTATLQQLQELRVDNMYGNIFNDSTIFCIEHGLDEKDIQEKRISLKKKKKISGENQNDERLSFAK